MEIYGDGAQTRDFIYIDDLIDAIILASKKNNIGGETFQIASSKEITISEMTNKLINELKLQGIENVSIKNSSKRIGDVRRNFSDTSKAKNNLGWDAKVDLKKGLFETVKYFLKKDKGAY